MIESEIETVVPAPEARSGFKKFFWAVFRIAFTFFMFWLIAGRVDFARLKPVLRAIQPGWLAVAFALLLFKTIVAAAGMRELLRSVCLKIPLLRILKINFFSFYFSYMSQFVGGAVRWGYLSGNEGRRGEALFAIAMERVQRLLVIFAVFLPFLCLEAFGHLTRNERHLMSMFSAAMVTGFSVFFIVFWNAGIAGWLGGWFLKLGGRGGVFGFIGRKISDLIRVWGVCRAEGPAFMRCCLFWLTDLVVALFLSAAVLRAVHIDLPWQGLAWIFPLIMLANNVPVTVFGLGIREGIMVYFLPRYGITTEAALAAGLLIFMLSITIGMIGGTWFAAESFAAKRDHPS